MSMLQANAFGAAGCSVTLYMPDNEQHSVAQLLEQRGVPSLDALPRYGADFDIRVVRSADDFEGIDTLIWQSYRLSDESLYPKSRISFQTTKSFPRSFVEADDRAKKKLSNLLKRFDRLAFAQRRDAEIAETLAAPADRPRIAYVPRGFSHEWLNRESKTDVPSFACDAAVKAEDGGAAAVRHMAEIFEKMTGRGDAFEVIAARGAAKLLGTTRRVGGQPLLDFYDSFINPAWIYMPCDFLFSVHNQNLALDSKGRKVFIGMFENQVIEAQMSGGLVLVRENDIEDYNLFDPAVCTVPDYNDVDDLLARVDAMIADFPALSRRARAFAIERFSLTAMENAWSLLLRA